MTTETRALELRVRVRPKSGIVRSGLLILLIVPLPIFGSLALLSAQNGPWPFAAFGEALCLLLCWLGLALYRRVFIGVTSKSIEERGLLGRHTSHRTADVATIVLAHTFGASSADTLPQLIVRDRAGTRMLRMRGLYWTEESMLAVANAIGEEVQVVKEPMTSAEFFARYPGSAYWFENRRGLAIAALAAALLVCVGVVLGLMQLLGLPIDS
ncbi:hypothetical protein [Lacisediminihabitans profunda]|uniref:PH domain-containing protein n=1 Tax=Lacisediminihabitans profunda TaxID=2594790 RepID=A0A5C8UXR5_9MICO|nr:hypothetical protein [Lacisediminihabitans profunda]TXN32469.1 hypothetical protein FVP33_02365 [Lacisediminihabitans profunda]